MAVNIQKVSEKINDQLLNGDDFNTNADTNFAPNLIGISGEKVRVRQLIDVSAVFYSSASNKVTMFSSVANNLLTLELTTGNWFAEGFAVGDTVNVFYNIAGTSYLNASLITSMSETVLYGSWLAGQDVGGSKFQDLNVINVTIPNFLEYRAGLVDNTETSDFLNKVTGEDQRWYADGIADNTPNFVTALPTGLVSSYVDGSVKVRHVSSATDARGVYINRYEIHHELILPYFRDGDFQTLSNRQAIDLYEGDKTLKYVNGFSFTSTKSNPTGAKKKTIDYTLGSTGAFGETFNGFQSNYEVVDIAYIDADTLAPFQALKSVGRTKVTIHARKKVGEFTTGERVGLYISYLPTSDEYTGTKTGFVENFMYQNCFCSIGGAPVSNGYIYAMQATKTGANLTVVFDVELSVAQQLRIYDKDSPNYLIGLQMCTGSIALASSDKVTELADVNTFSNELILEGLAQSDGIEIWEHDKTFADTGYSSFYGWVEDGILTRFKFSLDLSKQAKILSLSQKLIAYNTTNPFKSFDLDKTLISLAGMIEVNGVQQLEIDKTKGYPLAVSDNFNLLTFSTLAKTGDLQQYEIVAGQKLPWQSWQKIKADSSFFDKTKPNNGFNRKSDRYSEVNDFSIRMCYVMALGGIDDQGREGITEYQFISPPIVVQNYMSPSGWNATIETFDPETMESLNKSVLSDRLTYYRITWEKVGFPIMDDTGYYCINRIEVSGQGSFAKSELSTVAPVADNSPLVPLDGKTQLHMRVAGGKIIAECLIDPSKINMNNGLNLSGRISTSQEIVPVNAKIMEDTTPKHMEDSIYKILE